MGGCKGPGLRAPPAGPTYMHYRKSPNISGPVFVRTVGVGEYVRTGRQMPSVSGLCQWEATRKYRNTTASRKRSEIGVAEMRLAAVY